MKKQELYVITEKQYSNTNWYKCIMDGLYREATKKSFKIVICKDSDLKSFEPDTILVLIGSSQPFIKKHLQLCTQFSLRPILAGFDFQLTYMPVSYITVDRYSAMVDMIRTLVLLGAKSIALLGVNLSVQTDMQRHNGYLSAVQFYGVGNPETDVYFSDNGFSDCMDSFWKNVHNYDAVACVNDWYAAYICSHASKYGVSIPEDLMVTGFGNTLIGQYTNPPLTTVSLNLSSVGAQVLTLHHILSQNPALQACTEVLKTEIILRDSTSQIPKNDAPACNPIVLSENAFSEFNPADESNLEDLYVLENSIGNMDEINYKIVRGILDGFSYQALAEKLFLSDTAFKYRLQKIFALVGCKTRSEFIKLFKDYIPKF